MKRGSRQSSECLRKKISRETLRFCQSAPGDLLREKGRAGNRGGAAATKKANFEDASVLDACRKLENVSTGGVADFNASCRIGEVTGIARITEVIEDGCAEHFQKYLSNLFELGMRLPKATYILRLKSIRITPYKA
jgi:hypothetical protein